MLLIKKICIYWENNNLLMIPILLRRLVNKLYNRVFLQKYNIFASGQIFKPNYS